MEEILSPASLGEGLRILQARAGLSREELARAAGVSSGAVSNYFNDVSVPSAAVLLRICLVLADRLRVPVPKLWVGLALLLDHRLVGDATTHPNEVIVRAACASLQRGDCEGLCEVLSDDVVLHLPGRHPTSGAYQGMDGALRLCRELAAHGEMRIRVHDVLVNDEHAVAVVTRTVSRDDFFVESREVVLFHVREGKIVEGWVHPLDAEELHRVLSLAANPAP